MAHADPPAGTCRHCGVRVRRHEGGDWVHVGSSQTIPLRACAVPLTSVAEPVDEASLA